MTTIAYKNGVMAADGRLVVGSIHASDNYNKIEDCSDKEFYINGERVLFYGLAGYLRGKEVFEYCMEEGVTPASTIQTDDQFQVIAVCEKNTYFLSKEDESPMLDSIKIQDGIPCAIGSGLHVAYHILATTDLDPLDAVQEACKSDIHSGGTLTRRTR